MNRLVAGQKESEERMFEGIYTPIVTPFSRDGAIDYAKLSHNLDLLTRTDLSGVLVLGSNGEFPYLSMQEKIDLVKFVKENWNPGKRLFVGTGCEATRDTLELSKRVSDYGAEVVLVLPPHYYKGLMKEDVLFTHFATVADRSSLPVMLYNMPANTGINLSSSLVAKLSHHENIVGIKDSSGSIVQIAEIIRSSRKGFSVLAGSASFMLPALSVGAHGATTALGNILPNECCRLFYLFQERRWEEAKKLQLRMLEINHTVTTGLGVPGLKAAMDLLGYRGGLPRRPLLPLPEDKRRTLEEVLVRCGALERT
jgi:4-hydroxy-2-oxoglutarate aldolase